MPRVWAKLLGPRLTNFSGHPGSDQAYYTDNVPYLSVVVVLDKPGL